jgi:hypothetical protein
MTVTHPCDSWCMANQHHVLALFNPKTSILFQIRHPYTGSVNSEKPGDSKNVVLHCENVLAHVNSEVRRIDCISFGHKHKPLLLLAVCISFDNSAGWHMLQLTPSGVRALSSSCRSLSLLRSRSSLLSRSGEGPTRHQSVPSMVYHYLSSNSGGMQQRWEQ